MKDYFGEWQTGRLGRGRFALLYLILLAVAAAIIFALAGSLAMSARSMATAINDLSPAVSGLLLLLFVALQIAVLNIIAKRGRDIGLSGLLTVVIFIVVAMGGMSLLGQPGAFLAILALAFLLLAPSNLIGAKSEA